MIGFSNRLRLKHVTRTPVTVSSVRFGTFRFTSVSSGRPFFRINLATRTA